MLAIAVFGSALFTFALFGSARLMAGDKTDESTKVTATVTLPKELASFTDRTLELRLYEYDPLLADVGADLVEKISKDPFSHSEGKATELTIEIGAKGKVKPRRRYYLTIFFSMEIRGLIWERRTASEDFVKSFRTVIRGR